MNRELLTSTLKEDFADLGDVTGEAIFKNEQNQFVLIAKQSGILCGILEFKSVIESVDNSIEIKLNFKDGDKIEENDEIAILSGKVSSILKAERTALNILAHLSGIASKTSQFVEASKGKSIILDTRKTLPGLRKLQKYAVRCGGGQNHRMGLFDMVMIKDNHIDAAGGISKAVQKIRDKWQNRFGIEVETRNLQEVKEALECKVDRIMLDNMNCEMMKKAVEIISGKCETEASGNMTLERIPEVSDTGVDFISVGELTHSVKAFDFSLRKAPLCKGK
ncbi:MAG: carboxylating nicotinate-nucleotide diphosphorylase [Candidatus Cloacimonetes bacterium]|nr:carboxylating nicotinate-nucleotide diphosphorylase [Candidatus Cloacimonadota bacterium]MCF7813216.1 carboxylating nicotinate-nucleotide diphosphorylase [Candidatus Cloacimonadota bacterium]MCF7867415.1 carboxylating nicotinate-nucleotide diphosphorylase [Candidatus Cloacimonadota bacterium]MCF7882953.1 carboxylating nicotinate-nucleotide diphosphorylase [Candidatus Cloacimonadota bacterium]